MSHSHGRLYFHAVWGTKERRPYLLPHIQKRVSPYIQTIISNKRATPIAIGGIHDHLHLLFQAPPTCQISNLIQRVKIGSSRFINQTNGFLNTFSWQKGYSVFVVPEEALPRVARYINNQYEHHEVHSYQDEIDLLMKCNGIPKDY